MHFTIKFIFLWMNIWIQVSNSTEYKVEELAMMKKNQNYKTSSEGNNNCLLFTKYSDPDMNKWLSVFSKVAEKHQSTMEGTINFAFIDVEDLAEYGMLLFQFGYSPGDGTRIIFINLDKTHKPKPKPTFWDAPMKLAKFDETKVAVYHKKIDDFVKAVSDGNALKRGDRLFKREEL